MILTEQYKNPLMMSITIQSLRRKGDASSSQKCTLTIVADTHHIITISSSSISAMTSMTMRKKMKGKKYLTSKGGKVVSPSRLTTDKLRVICTMGSTASTNANRIAKQWPQRRLTLILLPEEEEYKRARIRYTTKERRARLETVMITASTRHGVKAPNPLASLVSPGPNPQILIITINNNNNPAPSKSPTHQKSVSPRQSSKPSQNLFFQKTLIKALLILVPCDMCL
jgi:hypothetical protein